MTPSSRLKTALLAAASLTAATVAIAHQGDAAPYEPVAIEHAAASVDHDADRDVNQGGVPAAAGKIGIAAAAAAVFAGLLRLIGLDRLKAAVSAAANGLVEAARAGVAVTAAASKAVIRAASSPLRFVAMIAGLSAIGFAGIGFYDLEWAGGLVVGAAAASLIFLGAGRLRKQLAPARLPASH